MGRLGRWERREGGGEGDGRGGRWEWREGGHPLYVTHFSEYKLRFL